MYQNIASLAFAVSIPLVLPVFWLLFTELLLLLLFSRCFDTFRLVLTGCLAALVSLLSAEAFEAAAEALPVPVVVRFVLALLGMFVLPTMTAVRALLVSITDLVAVPTLPSQLETLAFREAAAEVAVLSRLEAAEAVVLVGVDPARLDLGSNTGPDLVDPPKDPVEIVFGKGRAEGLRAV